MKVPEFNTKLRMEDVSVDLNWQKVDIDEPQEDMSIKQAQNLVDQLTYAIHRIKEYRNEYLTPSHEHELEQLRLKGDGNE